MNKTEATMEVKAAFEAIANLAAALGEYRLSDLPGAWLHDVDETWQVAINPHSKPVEIAPTEKNMGGVIDPYHAAIWYKGWLAGLLNPFSGVIASGKEANEDTFIAACQKAVEQIKAGGK